jgi:NAD(P)-dependent dehydrogenase (short-subunit alcohol dehydrogenase family)
MSSQEDMLEGSWAVVSGGSRGIGHAICEELAGMGVNVLVLYLHHEDGAEEAAANVRAAGVEASTMRLDVADGAAVAAALGAFAEAHPEVGVLVNCAGITIDRTVLKLEPEDWDRVIATNLSSCYHCTRALLPAMRARSFGRIVSISSIIGQTGNLGQTNYAASKAGIIGFTKSLALETARYDITANAICPGFIDTHMLDPLSPEMRDALLTRIPKGRFGRPEDVARTVGFLTAPEASYITGAVLNVNGGMYL